MTKEEVFLLLGGHASCLIAATDVKTVRDSFREIASRTDEQWEIVGRYVKAVDEQFAPPEPPTGGKTEH